MINNQGHSVYSGCFFGVLENYDIGIGGDKSVRVGDNQVRVGDKVLQGGDNQVHAGDKVL